MTMPDIQPPMAPQQPNLILATKDTQPAKPPAARRTAGLSLGTKLALLIVALAVVLSAATILFGYNQYSASMEQLYITNADDLARSAVSMLQPDRIRNYVESGRQDSTYLTQQTVLRAMARDSEMEGIFVIIPEEDGLVYVFDTDEGADQVPLGQKEAWYDGYLPYKEEILHYEDVPPVFTHSKYGYRLTALQPVMDARGDNVAYVGVDLDMQGLLNDQHRFLLMLAIITVVITLGFTAFFIYAIRRTVVRPLKKMAAAADDFLVTGSDASGAKVGSSIAALEVHTRDELESLADSLKSMERKIKEYIESLDDATQRAETDQLTGTFNRDSFEHQVKAFLHTDSGTESLHAFVMIDIDFFKQVNDTYGHAYGDEVLKCAAAALDHSFRSADVVSRLGGDEFAVFAKSIGTKEKIAEKADELCAAIRAIRIEALGDAQLVTCSVGIALYPGDGSTYDELYRHADMAMYESKEAGRNRFTFYDSSIAKAEK